MARPKRTPEQIDHFRETILDSALDIIQEYGYAGFSMRKLASRVGVTATALYDYFTNKDEIYLHILIRGFTLLYDKFNNSVQGVNSPKKKLERITMALLEFGKENNNYYDLMFTWFVPKQNQYNGTDLEGVASAQLEAALKNKVFCMSILSEYTQAEQLGSDINTELLLLRWLTAVHGVISLSNNQIMRFIHNQSDNILRDLALSYLEGTLAKAV